MTAPSQPRRAWFQISLATGFLLMIEVAAIVLICLRSEPWVPLAGPLTRAQMELRYGCWIALDATPDGSRCCRRERLRNVSITDSNGVMLCRFWPESLPCGFLDDDTFLTTSYTRETAESPQYWLWRRRFPEFWWGQLYRPEIWIAIVVGIALALRASRSRQRSHATA